MSLDERTRADACPGALRLHDAADGALARVRVPGGRVSAAQLRALVELSVAHGDGNLDFTSRGNVQIRGLAATDASPLAEALRGADMLPSAEHERVRNIQASPLAGLDDRGHGALDDLVGALDQAICAEPRLAAVSGRYLWGLDDGRGDVAGVADAAWLADTPRSGRLVLAGQDTGIAVPRAVAVQVLREVTLAYLDLGRGWRLRDEPVLAGRLAADVRHRHAHLLVGPAAVLPNGEPAVIGPVVKDGSVTAVVAGVPLGRLTAVQAARLAELVGTGRVLLTPWRSVVVPGVSAERLTEIGLVCRHDSAWAGVTACAGMPSCVKALADVRAEAARSAAAARPLMPMSLRTASRPSVHWSGCERRCGQPQGEHISAVALPGGGYTLDDVTGEMAVVSAERAADYVAALREPTTDP